MNKWENFQEMNAYLADVGNIKTEINALESQTVREHMAPKTEVLVSLINNTKANSEHKRCSNICENTETKESITEFMRATYNMFDVINTRIDELEKNVKCKM